MNKYLEKCPWLAHYIEMGRNQNYLAFSKDFMEENLPKPWEYKVEGNENFQVELVLRKNPSDIFLATHNVFYEFQESMVLDERFILIDAYILQYYMYSEHYCSCNRLHDAERAGYIAKEEDYEESEKGHCGEIIFDIKKIYCKNLPNLILYSETMSMDELEDNLNGHK